MRKAGRVDGALVGVDHKTGQALHGILIPLQIDLRSDKYHGQGPVQERITVRRALHTASQSRASLRWPAPGPAAGPVCTPLTRGAGTEQAAPHQGTDAAPDGDRSETKTPGTDCAHRCSK